MSQKIITPCIQVCKLENNICIGCKRTKNEIRDWTIITHEEREIIMKRIRLNKNK